MTEVRDFVGVDTILQGEDWARTITFDASMVAYDPVVTPGAVLRGALVSSDFATVYCQTSDGTMILSWLDPVTLSVGFSAAGTTAAPPFTGGIWQVEGVNGADLKVARLAEGRANMTREACTSAT